MRRGRVAPGCSKQKSESGRIFDPLLEVQSFCFVCIDSGSTLRQIFFNMSKIRSALIYEPHQFEGAYRTAVANGEEPELIHFLECRRDRNRYTVFRDLFRQESNLVELYQALHPAGPKVQTDDISVQILDSFIANGLRNTLGFFVGLKPVIVLDIQSDWSANAAFEGLDCLARLLAKIAPDDLGAPLIEPEVYIVLPGKTGPVTMEIADLLIQDAALPGRQKDRLTFQAQCIYQADSDTILGQYIRFTAICEEQIRKWGPQIDLASLVIRRLCLLEGVLPEYMEQVGDEFERMIESKSEAEIQQLLLEDCRADGRLDGIAEGEAAVRRTIIEKALKQGILSHEQIAEITEATPAQVAELARGLRGDGQPG